MKLKEYVRRAKEQGITINELCEDLGISRVSLWSYLNAGARPHKRVARDIVRFTHGAITMKDLGWEDMDYM